MTTAVSLLLALSSTTANAGLVDEYASRYDWACAFNDKGATCGGPDTKGDLEAAHTVVICQDAAGDMECGHTWRYTAKSEEDLAAAVKAWGQEVEAELGNDDWLLTPSRLPEAWMATLRNRVTLAALEVGPDWVQIRTEQRPICASKTVGKDLQPYVIPVLPEVEGDEVEEAMKLPWDEANGLRVPPITDSLVEQVINREERLEYDKSSLQRWTLLASEPFQCMMELRNQKDHRSALRYAFAEWRMVTNPTKADKKLMRQAAKEQSRLGKKHRDVGQDGDEGLEDE